MIAWFEEHFAKHHVPLQSGCRLSTAHIVETFLRRSIDSPLPPRLQDFVSAVMDVDYSPTGREFVAGSYDRSVRRRPASPLMAHC